MSKKSKILCGIFWLTIFGFLITSSNVFAIGFSYGEIEGNIDSTFTLGASFRVEDRDFNLIGKANQPNYYNDPYKYTDKDAAYESLFGQGKVTSGIWSNNGDDGDLNFDTGLISEVVKMTTDFSFKYRDFGFFARAMFFYDYYIMSESEDMRVDIIANKDAEDQVGTNIDLLDAFIYYNSYIAEIPFSFRAGRQVINWGESSYIPHGISESNPIDVGRLRGPGAELKEAFIPVGSLWTSVGFTETINFETFYQLEFKRMIPDAPGSYFSTNDFIGDGGNFIQSSFHRPDLKQFGVYKGSNFNHVVERLDDKEASDSGQYGLKLSWFAEELNGTEFGFYFVNYHSRRPLISGHVHDGVPEYIADAGLLAKGMSNSMLSNLSRGEKALLIAGTSPTDLPFISDEIKAEAAKVLFQPGEVYGSDSDFAGHTRDGWIHGYTEYPEDIKLMGLSFNTVLPNGMSVAGEFSYRMDEPLQIDDVELIMALSSPLYDLLLAGGAQPLKALNPAGVDANGKTIIDTTVRHPFYSQHPDGDHPKEAVPGDYIIGYQRFDVSQGQVSFTQLFSDFLGASKMTALAELGYVYVHDLPDQDVLRFDATGTYRSGNAAHAGLNGIEGFFNPAFNLQSYAPEGIEENDFASAFSWGYKLMVQLNYSNVFSGVNVSPKFRFDHDVYGATPTPIGTFLKHRKSASVNINFDYQRKWSLDIGGKMFWGAGNANRMADRDYVWMTIKYAI
ncbi:secreted protein containing DUF1302 [Candidatus Magnetomorum sp. HK-1]|nr:secreted protein containing DUF1302 [Candidatus Magnetomorum sp. HK-1]